MKNVRENQMKKCIFLTQTEMEDILTEILQKPATMHTDLYGFSVCIKDNEEPLGDSYICDALSEYFDVKVTSVHIDDCEYVGIWVCYKEN